MVRRTTGLLSLVTLGLCGVSVADPTPLPPHRAEYLLTRDALPFAVMAMRLDAAADGRYRYEAKTHPHKAMALVGMAMDISSRARVRETSEGRTDGGRFRPNHYRNRRDNEETRELSIDFDWAKGRASIESENKPWSMPVPDGALDKLAVLLALRGDLAAGAKDVSYPVADGGKLKSYRYRVIGQEEITTSAGTWNTVEVIRSKQGGPTDYRIWLAPELLYLPVLVEREEKGVLYRMELTGLERIAEEPSATGRKKTTPSIKEPAK